MGMIRGVSATLVPELATVISVHYFADTSNFMHLLACVR